MSKEARSRGACWTCRLRRKKCDEKFPVCSACTSLAVPCYGYDPKPAWADGGVRQKAKAEELQIIIRELASLRRRSRRKRVVDSASDLVGVEKYGVDEALLDARPSNVASTANKGSNGQGARFNNAPPKEQLFRDLTAPVDIETLEISESPPTRKILTSNFLEYDSQANLLMHYLDVVFPNQFPFYSPSPSDGGRGWLLLIILRTKPLYHAALSMAAYHQQTQNFERSRSQTLQKGTVDTLQSHHSLAIKELRHHLDSFKQEERAQSLEGNIEVLACIVFLISLEVS
jgi:hypothetical protein